ncbi:MAG: Ankyrin repeats (3 copies) [Verrucomicrobia bacterium ADurb.Bin345]|nr:MAG: Ankyrin repeats (3 copies) [Verrucomicrobia bacterium ADurb.Bin345]
MPVWQAVGVCEDPETLKKLLESGVDIEARDHDGRTLLIVAAEQNPNHEIVQLLLDAGADVAFRTKFGVTALGQAARRNPNPKVLNSLRELISASSMRLEISTSCSRVSRGTWPICLRYIRTGSSSTSTRCASFARSSFSIWDLNFCSSESSMTSMSMPRRRMRMPSNSSGLTTLSGMTSFTSS